MSTLSEIMRGRLITTDDREHIVTLLRCAVARHIAVGHDAELTTHPAGEGEAK